MSLTSFIAPVDGTGATTGRGVVAMALVLAVLILQAIHGVYALYKIIFKYPTSSKTWEADLLERLITHSLKCSLKPRLLLLEKNTSLCEQSAHQL